MKLKYRAKCAKQHVILGNAYSTSKGFMCQEHYEDYKKIEIPVKEMPEKEIIKIRKGWK